MLFASVFNSIRGDPDQNDDDTSGIMKNHYQGNTPGSYSLDNDEDKYLLNTPRRSSKNFGTSDYLDDMNYYSSDYSRKYNNQADPPDEIVLEDTLQKIKQDYEKSKQALQNSSRDYNSYGYKSIFGNGSDMDEENDKLLKIKLNKGSRKNSFGNIIPGGRHNRDALREDSIYNFDDMKQEKNPFESNLDISYTPLRYTNRYNSLEREEDSLRYRAKQDQQYKNSNSNFYNTLKLELERDRNNDRLREYQDSIQRYSLQLEKQNDHIADLDNKYLKLCSIIGKQKAEVLQLKNGLENERLISRRVNSRLQILNERLSETKSLLYKAQMQKNENSNANRVRFDGSDRFLNEKKRNSPLPSPSSSPLLNKTRRRSIDSLNDDENMGFNIEYSDLDMDNTQHVLKLASKYQS